MGLKKRIATVPDKVRCNFNVRNSGEAPAKLPPQQDVTASFGTLALRRPRQDPMLIENNDEDALPERMPTRIANVLVVRLAADELQES